MLPGSLITIALPPEASASKGWYREMKTKNALQRPHYVLLALILLSFLLAKTICKHNILHRVSLIPQNTGGVLLMGCIAFVSLDSDIANAVYQSKTTDFSKVQAGTLEISQEPRAMKRRAMGACKSSLMFELIQKAEPSIDSTKTCLQRVVVAENTDPIIKSINSAIKDLPVEQLQGLSKKYGDKP